jgi:hypothetical protein
MNGQRQRFPSWAQALVIFCSGIVLGFSSCFAFLANVNGNQTTAEAFAIGFFIGVGVTLAGLVLILIRAIRGA